MMDTPMENQHHPYDPARDLHRLLALVAAETAAGATRVYPGDWHVGDVLWQWFRAPFDAAAQVRVWDDAAGDLAGFVVRDGAGGVDIQPHPRYAANVPLLAAMLDWAKAHGTDNGTLSTVAADGDTVRRDLLTGRSYERGPHDWLHMEHDLRRALSNTSTISGVVVRPLAGEHEFAARVALHRAVWQGSKVTEATYAAMRAVPGYDPALDLVAVLPDGTFAAYCICWPDPVSGVGLFEPVGTHPAQRRHGYAALVIAEALRRLRAAGMHTARVTPTTIRPPAVALYDATGFRTMHRLGVYRQKR